MGALRLVTWTGMASTRRFGSFLAAPVDGAGADSPAVPAEPDSAPPFPLASFPLVAVLPPPVPLFASPGFPRPPSFPFFGLTLD